MQAAAFRDAEDRLMNGGGATVALCEKQSLPGPSPAPGDKELFSA
jgi:hypothetical protein